MTTQKMLKIVMIALMALVIGLSFAAPNVALADGFTDAPTSLTDTSGTGTDSPVGKLGGWVAQQLMYLYALMVAVVSIVFVVKHEYSKLVAFLVIAIIVAIPIFAPNVIPSIAESISKAITGK